MEEMVEKNPRDLGGGTPLHGAAEGGHLELCKLILSAENVVDKNPVCDHIGVTPLHLAAVKRHYEVCELIIQNVIVKNPADH